MRKEEVEQIDEKDTQNKRIAKAYVRDTSKPSEDGPADDADGDSQAQYRASREPGYDADSFYHHVRKQAHRHIGKDDPENRLNRYIKNDKHHGKYAKKTYKEEVEQIDETFSANKNPDTVLQSKKNKNGKLVHVPSRRTHQPGWSRAKEHFQRKQDEQDEKDNEMFRTKKWRSHKVFAKHLHKGTSRTIGQSRAKLLLKKRGESVDEAVELSASRKTKVNALLAKHQAKGLPSKPSKKYTREYTGDGLPLIAAVINQEETLNETKE
jgi:hypothetical protein